ncbi:MAG: 2OG-Fe(II) oxygenase [Pseudomonadota bacterium]
MPISRIVTALSQHGYCVVSRFFFAESAELRATLLQAWQTGGLTRAAVGQGPARQVRDAVRGDYVRWLEPSADPAIQSYFQAMETLRVAINRELFMGLFDYEAHFALYPPGAFYQKHRDGFVGDKRRKVSCVLYLNDDWQPHQGGALRLYTPAGNIDISPQAGTLACFLSDDMWHEVLPATRERLSITGWFKIRGV